MWVWETLAYMLPLVQLLRHDEATHGMLMKPRRPRAVVLCPTRELSEQVFRVAKSIVHHARFLSIMVSGGVRLQPQEDSLNVPVDMVVGTPGRVLQHIEDGNMVFGDINYLDEADTMFDRGVENLNKFKSDSGDCPTLVCTDLAARELDLDVVHVIMLDFLSTSIDYLHRTGRTAHMRAKDNVTSLVGKKDLILAERIEEAIRKIESLESLTADSVRRDAAKPCQGIPSKNALLLKLSNQKKTSKAVGKVAQPIS